MGPVVMTRRLRTARTAPAALAVVAGLALGAPATVAQAASGWWTPPQQLTWYWQLTGNVNNSEPVAVYDIDGFENSAAEVATLHAQDKHVICYIDVGTAEDFRPDYSEFPESVLGSPTGGRASAGWTSASSACSSRS